MNLFRQLSFLLFVAFQATSALCQDTFFPKEDNGKWGIATEYMSYKKKKPEKEQKWIFKPQWDHVWIDSSRYGCQRSSTCDAFITLKKGKYGYALANGTFLENEYELINMSRHVVKKNGLWGAYDDVVQLLPFEYDSLSCHTFNASLYQRIRYDWDYNGNDTGYFFFTGKKAGKWDLLIAKLPKKGNSAIVKTLSSGYEAALSYDNGYIIQTNGKWKFADLRGKENVIYSNPYDAIVELDDLYGVKKQDKWFVVQSASPNMTGGKGWDRIERTGIYNYMAVWEKGLAGAIAYENNYLKEVLSPRGTDVQIVRGNYNNLVFQFTENGKKITYDKTGKVLSSSGDVTVNYEQKKGPFRIESHNDYAYTVYDAATNAVLIPKSKIDVTYSNEPGMGHVLYVEDKKYSLSNHGLYHYDSKTYIHPEYKERLHPFGTNWMISRKYLTEDFIIWDKKTMQQVKLPFVAKDYKNEYQVLLKDANGQWHEMDAQYTDIASSKVVRSRTKILGGIEIEETEDNVKTVTSFNGKPVNYKIMNQRWQYGGKVCEITMNGKKTEYFENKGTTLSCNYQLSANARYIEESMADKLWPGESFPVPQTLFDSANTWVVVNKYNNKRMILPMKIRSDGVMMNEKLYTGKNFEVCSFSCHADISFCDKETRKCGCNNGQIAVGTRTETIKGETTYTTTTSTSVKKGSESKWDSKTNSYKRVDTYTPSTSYDVVAQKGADREVEKVVFEKCPVCDGKGIYEFTKYLLWDGNTLQERNTF